MHNVYYIQCDAQHVIHTGCLDTTQTSHDMVHSTQTTHKQTLHNTAYITHSTRHATRDTRHTTHTHTHTHILHTGAYQVPQQHYTSSCVNMCCFASLLPVYDFLNIVFVVSVDSFCVVPFGLSQTTISMFC